MTARDPSARRLCRRRCSPRSRPGRCRLRRRRCSPRSSSRAGAGGRSPRSSPSSSCCCRIRQRCRRRRRRAVAISARAPARAGSVRPSGSPPSQWPGGEVPPYLSMPSGHVKTAVENACSSSRNAHAVAVAGVEADAQRGRAQRREAERFCSSPVALLGTTQPVTGLAWPLVGATLSSATVEVLQRQSRLRPRSRRQVRDDRHPQHDLVDRSRARPRDLHGVGEDVLRAVVPVAERLLDAAVVDAADRIGAAAVRARRARRRAQRRGSARRPARSPPAASSRSRRTGRRRRSRAPRSTPPTARPL